jgi:hypothetical protein
MEFDSGHSLSKLQSVFISLTITAMVLQGQLCWAVIERVTLGNVCAQALSWMMHHSRIPWSNLMKSAIGMIFELYKVAKVTLVIDDTDRPRSKVIRVLYAVFKTLDKKTGGYINAQNIVFIVVVSKICTFPIGFAFFRPDPKYTKWKANDKQLRKKKVPKKLRPTCPPHDRKRFPTKIEIAAKLLLRAEKLLSGITVIIEGRSQRIRVMTIVADAAYMRKQICRVAHHCFPKAQVISQLAKSQICWNKNGIHKRVDEMFAHQTPVTEKVELRGTEQTVHFCSARLFIKSHGIKLHVVALKYDGETDYRYLAATDLTWRTIDIIRAYALRWLIEVVIEDWKQHDGFGRKAYQQRAAGACRGVFLSLLVDYFLLQHPRQLRLHRMGQPLCTAGTLVQTLQFENILHTIKAIVDSPDPHATLEEFSRVLPSIVRLRPSSKHMQGRDIGEFEPSLWLERRQRKRSA